MKKHQRILLIVLGFIILIAIIVGLSANTIVENKLKKYIANDLPENIEITYKDIKVNTFSGNLTAKDLLIFIKDKNKDFVVSKFDLKDFKVEDVSLMNYLFGKKITIDEILLDKLTITHYNLKKKPENEPSKKKETKDIPISIETINFKNASVTVYENRQDSVLFSSERVNFSIHDVFFNKETRVQKIPIDYSDYSLEIDNAYVKAGSYNTISIDKVTKANSTLSLSAIQFKTKYTKRELSKIIPFEKDHYIVTADSINFTGFNHGFIKDTFFLNTEAIDIDNAIAYIYRDKLVKDDHTLKEMFSKSIRELPLKLTVDSVFVFNSTIHYSQRKILGNKAGKMDINIDKASISNLSNTYETPEKTIIIVDGTFLRKTPFHANWSFDVNNKKEDFEFIGDLGKFSGEDINLLLTPIENVRLIGQIDHTMFHIIGNDNTSMIYMSHKYENIKVEILNKKKKKNKFISEIANVIIHNHSGTKKGEYNHITADATRDHAKAFFNFLVVNLKEASKVGFIEKKNKKYKHHKKHKVHIDLKKYHDKLVKSKKSRSKRKKRKSKH